MRSKDLEKQFQRIQLEARPGSGKEETTPAHSMKIISGADHTEAVEIPTTEISTLNKLITQQQTAYPETLPHPPLTLREYLRYLTVLQGYLDQKGYK
ncbi:hypothetical protein ADUPG1_008821, partial [Aduncisulcus paluster]